MCFGSDEIFELILERALVESVLESPFYTARSLVSRRLSTITP
jgi:hypothetical protein